MSIISIGFLTAQESESTFEKSTFLELNTGVALISSGNLENSKFIAPGISFLIGKTFINDQNNFFEYQIGIAAPTIATAKIGIGKKIKNTKISVGVRPYPLSLYSQVNIKAGEKNFISIGLEGNPFGTESRIAFESLANFNVGYRWTLKGNNK